VYGAFAQQIDSGVKHRGHRITVITFNYDVALDFALGQTGIPIEYCLSGNPVGREKIRVLKLHGSIGWGVTPGGETVACRPQLLADGTPTQLAGNTVKASLRLASELKNLIKKDADKDLEHYPVIVPPGIYKYEYQGSLD
jgi:hypothetical protein